MADIWARQTCGLVQDKANAAKEKRAQQELVLKTAEVVKSIGRM